MKIFKKLHVIGCGGIEAIMKPTRGLSFLHSSSTVSVEVHSLEHEVVIAVGSNVGDRIFNFNEALKLMKSSGIRIMRHGCLYETKPAYVLDQPLFLNTAVRGFTKLAPHDLLAVLKKIEKDMGRTGGIRYGPRPIDLDILFYGKFNVQSETLIVPHERIWERPFVLAPLIDLLGSAVDNDTVASWHSYSRKTGGLFEAWEKLGGESLIGRHELRRVLPVGKQLLDWSERTRVMGILNLTPDSFSDGGKYQSVEAAVSQVRLMISEGADIIDIGAQSTRPFATMISADEELDRVLPVVEALLELPEMEGKFLSVDTFHSKVAQEAVSKGVHLVNDVSSGQLDPNMFSVVASLGVPYVMMHMRGDPSTMQNDGNLHYENVCKQVASELYLHIRDAESSGIPAWRLIIDPGIGFSKKTKHNLEILSGLETIREEFSVKSLAASHVPILVGPSRKRFLGDICNRPNAIDRDPATVSAVTSGILNGANIVRVHNVRDNLDAARLCDALLKYRQSYL
ncbi:hypothetical protein Scep_027282 [Stephania cephalantha]|uniref:Pterin-binding domain-containing protein n=1 Tax=Stephania cephalantha TaxID=152367 RepID=A0AAP0HMF1_9MAGN